MVTAETKFFLFGMGNRTKIIYKKGALYDALNGNIIKSWETYKSEIYPEKYAVLLHCPHGIVEITEDCRGVAVSENGRKDYITEDEINLPDFSDKKHSALLRILHHEILFNILEGKPLPNLFVYSKPWYRDAAMMCMCLEKTGNLRLVKKWIKSLRQPYDKNNAGHCEPDNLGQALYMISLISDRNHPLVQTLLEEAEKVRKHDYITGLTDFGEHPVYQTKWLKYGLAHLRMEDNWKIPVISDSYSQLFWMDYKDEHADCERFSKESIELYPYLGWAQAHFYDTGFGEDTPLSVSPLTWECQASQANYEGIRKLSAMYADAKYCSPHTWHSAEAFLYLYEDIII